MLLGHELGWWGFWVGIAAILLTIPLAVVGNVLTPKLVNWWSERSHASLVKRIALLEDRLKDLQEHHAEYSPELGFLLRLLLLFALAIMGLDFFLVAVLTSVQRLISLGLHPGAHSFEIRHFIAAVVPS